MENQVLVWNTKAITGLLSSKVLETHQKNQKMENQVLVWNLKLLMVFSQVRFWKHTQKKKNWLRMCSCNTPKKLLKGKASVSLEPIIAIMMDLG